ncbi:MAG TPA: class 1 fructose-bisphosphatase [Balneolales bacterium]|nr:class 1 fructose-bisphosphatase [Balneolales bacterium]
MTSQNVERLITQEEFIISRQNRFPGATGELSQLLRDIGLAAKIISREVNKAGITHILGYDGSENVHGERVKKLDVFSNEQMLSALSRSGIVCMIISEENEGIVRLGNSSGKYIVYCDPLDGSSNIDVNVSIGTIFSIYMRKSHRADYPDEDDPMQPGTNQVAAGYIIYGSSTMMVYTTGLGVSAFTLDPSIGEFFLSHDNITIPEIGPYYSINEGSYNTWELGLKKYVKYCQEEDKETKRPYSARYIGSMVADVHRIMLKGGIFIYPQSKRYKNGKLRLMYECNPLGFIIEQAGGLATTGRKRIMEIFPDDIHQRTPIYIGSKFNVEQAEYFLQKYENINEEKYA